MVVKCNLSAKERPTNVMIDVTRGRRMGNTDGPRMKTIKKHKKVNSNSSTLPYRQQDNVV